MSIFLAKAFAIYFVVTGLAMVINPTGFGRMVDEFVNSSAVVALAGVLALIVGILVVLSHNVWEYSWRVSITLFGWLSIASGMIRLTFSEAAPRWIVNHLIPKKLRLIGIGLIVVGLFFGCVGSFCR